MGSSSSGPDAGMVMGKHDNLWSLELSLVCLKARWAEQRACPHGQEERWDVRLQTPPGAQLSGAGKGQPYSEQQF